MLHQILSLAGALLILGAYAANQSGLTGPRDRIYNLANFLGSGLLLWVAVVDQRIGFILLETAWALISLPHLVSPKRPPQTSTGT